MTINEFRAWQYGSHWSEERSNLVLLMASQFEVSIPSRRPLYPTPEAAAQPTWLPCTSTNVSAPRVWQTAASALDERIRGGSSLRQQSDPDLL